VNLWRIPLSEWETGHGEPELVKKLDYGGFSYDNSVTVTGDFGDITASDDGTADHVIWHKQPNGGVLLWGVGGGGDTTPQLWQDLRTGGWSYANSRPLAADVTGDGWDDLVVVHRNGSYDNIWIFPSDGHRLGAPQFWQYMFEESGSHLTMGDLDGDGVSELITSRGADFMGTTMSYSAYRLANRGGAYYYGNAVFQPVGGGGWSINGSRQLAGDVTGDGRADLVTVHAQPNGGILVWVHESCSTGSSLCLADPEIWQDLRTGGWSFAGSRQQLADSDGDGTEDLISIHSQSWNPGILVWRHLSVGGEFTDPGIIADLRTGGWTYSASREGVAHTYGTM